MEFWQMTNQEYAERLAFHRLLNHLECERDGLPEHGIPGKTSIDIDVLLEFIRISVRDATVDLNNRFPQRKAVEP
jgi:hypothetical protein